MANLSAGVYIQEIDNSAIVPTVSNSVAFFAGNFTKGPIEQPFVITTKDELFRYFGEPTDQNYNEWYQCYKFFDYGNQLIISRVFTEGITTTVEALQVGGISESATVVSIEDISKVIVGSIISFQGDSSTGEYEVTAISDDLSGRYDVQFTPPLGDSISGGANVYVKHAHINAGILAYQSPITGTPKKDYNQQYNLYKNEEDFNFKKDDGVIEVDSAAKLRFISRTAGDINSNIEIAIANPIDFEDYKTYTISGVSVGGVVDGPSKAEAFVDLPLTNFFQYPPVGEEIGIVIKQGDETESFVVSFDETAVDGNNKSKYVETVINEQSRFVYVVDNKQLGIVEHQLSYNIEQWEPGDAGTEGEDYDVYSSYIQSHLDADRQNNDWAAEGYSNIRALITYGGQNPIISNSGDIAEAYNEVEDKEYFEIDIVIGNEKDLGAAAINLAVTRADCIAFIGARYGDVVGKRSAEATNTLVDYMLGKTGSTPPQRSMFASFFGNYHKIYDNYSKKYRWINVAGDMAGLRANTNNARASWWASAGLRRGIIRNIDKIAFSPSEPQRDQLYKNSINPIVAFPGEGNICWGQKTLLNYASSFDRVNVRGLFNTIERAMAKAAKSSVFEFNDPFTRNAILAMFNPYLSGVKAGRGVEDFLVVCDTTNNTPDVISRNELVVDIYIKPMYAAEFIHLNFNNVGTRSFASVIGA